MEFLLCDPMGAELVVCSVTLRRRYVHCGRRPGDTVHMVAARVCQESAPDNAGSQLVTEASPPQRDESGHCDY